MLEERECPTCEQEAAFEVVGCGDGHGPDCPDRACTDCGTVLVVALAPAS